MTQNSNAILTDDERQDNPHAYNSWPANWLTNLGAWKKRREIKAKGLPDVAGCKMITLTTEAKGLSPQESYDKGSDQMRRFLAKLKTSLGIRKLGYIWKLEFNDNGYPHWHLVLLYHKKIPWQIVVNAWGLGQIDIRDMTSEGLEYLFKPAFPYEERSEKHAWILDYCKEGDEDKRPRCSIRFWQSRNFYTGARPTEKIHNREQKVSWVPLTLRERIEIWRRRMILVWPTPRGRRFRVIALRLPYKKIICDLLAAKAKAVTGRINEIPTVSINEINPHIPPWKYKKLNHILEHHAFEKIIAAP